jgi:hypothetical protein
MQGGVDEKPPGDSGWKIFVAGWERFITSPSVGTTIVVLGVATGLFGSIYTDELKRILRENLLLSATAGAWLFVASVAFTACAVFFRQKVIDRKRDQVQKRFDAAADDIPELIRTLPEPAFQRELGIVFEKTATLMPSLNDLQARAQGVNVALQGFAALAGKFDGGRLDDRFGANLMVYVEGDHVKPWLSKLKFYDRDKTELAGLLVLPAEFAAIANGEDKLPEFALPVPTDLGTSKESGGHGWRVLPGAPVSFGRNQFEHYSRTSELDEWCRDFGDFTEREKAELREHFKVHAAQISGFFCIPIRAPSTQYLSGGQRRPLAILNIHWDKCDRLDNPHSAKLFEHATFPLQVLLAQVLVELLKERAPEPDVRLSVTPAPMGAPPASAS